MEMGAKIQTGFENAHEMTSYNKSEEKGVERELLCDACGGYSVKSCEWIGMEFPYYLKP